VLVPVSSIALLLALGLYLRRIYRKKMKNTTIKQIKIKPTVTQTDLKSLDSESKLSDNSVTIIVPYPENMLANNNLD